VQPSLADLAKYNGLPVCHLAGHVLWSSCGILRCHGGWRSELSGPCLLFEAVDVVLSVPSLELGWGPLFSRQTLWKVLHKLGLASTYIPGNCGASIYKGS
jgi:hypothetical protein